MELLEREALLGDLDRLWEAARQGHGQFVFVGGEAGVGKTSLIRAFIEWVGAEARVMMGWCDPLSTPRPLGPLIDMAGSPGTNLARVVDEHGGRDRLLPAVLAELQRDRVLMVVEDAHWADEATLDLLRYLGRRVETVAAMIVTTYRDDEVGPDHPLRRLLGDLATASAVERLTIEPLSEGAVRAMAGDSVVDAGALYRKTGGNPFYVTEVLLAEGEGLPGTVRDAALARVGRLSPEAGELLAAASVIGTVVEPSLLAGVAGGTAPVDACIASGVLRVTDRDQYAFRHELSRDAVYSAIPAERRRTLHRSVLSALGTHPNWGGDVARLAHHAEEAGDGALVLSYAPAAAEQARARHSHREAAAQLRRAVRFAGNAGVTVRAGLHEALAVECMTISALEEGIEARNQAIALWREQGEPLKVSENIALKASLLVMNGQNAAGEAAIGQAMAMIRELPEARVHGLVYRVHAQIRMLNRDTDEAVMWGERAIATAERYGDVESVIAAENAVGSALLVAGRIDEGRAWLERSRNRAADAGLAGYEIVALSNLGSGAGEVHQFRMARDYLERAIALGTELDFDANRLYATSWLALCELHLGNWPLASDLAISVVNHQRAPAIGRIMAHLALGRLRARRGDPEVWAALDSALDLSEPTGTLQRLGPVRAARAEAAWLGGDRERCAIEARAAYGLAIDHQHAWFVGELAYWQWKAGVLDAPPDVSAEPYLLQMTGEWERGAVAWDALGCSYEAARARLESGDEQAMKQGLRAFEKLDARPAKALTVKALRDLGARHIPRGPRPSTRQNPANLTAREAEVLRLLMTGRRNAEIAEALFLTPKTVEHHVSSILAKLGATSRTEAVEAARALGL